MAPLLAHQQIPLSIDKLILGSLGGALAVATHVPGRAGEALAQTARRGFVSGMDLGLLVATVVVAVAGLVALVALPSKARQGRAPVSVPEDGEPRGIASEPSLDRSAAG